MSKDREEKKDYESFRDEYSFSDYLERSGYDPKPEVKPEYKKLFTIMEDRGRGYSKVLFRSQLEGKPDLYGFCTWNTAEDVPKQRITMNLHDLERLHDYLGKLLEIERGY